MSSASPPWSPPPMPAPPPLGVQPSDEVPSPTSWAANPMDDEDAAGACPRAAESAALKPVMS